jgi:hypothetical protein
LNFLVLLHEVQDGLMWVHITLKDSVEPLTALG